MRPFARSLGRRTQVQAIVSVPSSPFHRSISSLSGEDASSAPKAHPKPRYRDMASDANKYSSWTKNGLIQRVKELEAELRSRPAVPEPEASNGTSAPPPKKQKAPKGKKKMDPSKYTTRYIALKLAYLGKNYGGFEFQAMATQPSIEEELWNALTKACLIFPEDERVVDFDCCEYSKCGRTDRGVSAFGQVIGLKVRSNRPVDGVRRIKVKKSKDKMAIDPEQSEDETIEVPFDDIKDELQYPRLLNRILPPDIRILAWCPSPPPDFSARFSCRERQYRYFFTQPAFTPEPTASKSGQSFESGWLDINAMRDAAKRFEGEHDFRNFCKIDPGKQITNFSRVIYETDIVEVKDVASALPFLSASAIAQQGQPYPKVYTFNVRGSAFLWHQIRHMVAILFLVGQRLEDPSVVTQLLDVETNPCKPNYVMADEVPLVLWGCVFPGDDAPVGAAKKEDALEWIYLADDAALGKYGAFGVMEGMWALWRERKMDELLAGQLLQLISGQGGRGDAVARPETAATKGTVVYEGGNSGRQAGRYVPIMKKDKLQSPEEQNERYAIRKGYAGSEDMRIKKGFGKRKADESMADE